MKSFKLVCFSIKVLMIILFVSSCSKVPKSAKLIPQDAAIVVKVDVKDALEDCGVSANDEIKNKFKKMMKENNGSKKMQSLLTNIIDDPAKLGLDLRDPLFFYLDDKQHPYLVGSIYNAEDFTTVLNTIAKEKDIDKVKNKDDYYTFINGRTIIVYNSDMFYLGDRGYDQDEDDYIDNAKDLFKSEGKGTMLDSENMKTMCNADGFVQTLIQFAGLPMNDNKMKEITRNMPDGLELDDISVLFSLDSKDNAVSITSQVLTQNENWKKVISDFDQNLKDLDNELLKYVSKDGFAVLLSCDFQKILESSDMNSVLAKMNGEDKKLFKKLLGDISGEAVFSMTDFDIRGQYPELCFYAKTQDNSFVKEVDKKVDDNIKQGKYNYNNPIAYAKTYDPYWGYERSDYDNPIAYIDYGYKDNMYYAVAGNSPKSFKAASSPLTSSMIKGKGCYAYLPASFITRILNKNENDDKEIQAAQNIVKLFDYAELYYDGNMKYVLKVYGKKSDKNLVFDFLKQMISTFEKLSSSDISEDDDYVVAEEDTVAYSYDDEYDYAVADSVAAE